MKGNPFRRVCSYCEVIVDGHSCREPVAMAYPALGGGWMSLCVKHGEKHKAYSTPVATLRKEGVLFSSDNPQ